MVIHNPDVQTTPSCCSVRERRHLCHPDQYGSNYRSSAFVGANWIEIGERDTEAVVKACQGKSNKIAIIQAPCRRGERLHAEGLKTSLQEPGYQGGLEPGCRLGCSQAKAITQTV